MVPPRLKTVTVENRSPVCDNAYLALGYLWIPRPVPPSRTKRIDCGNGDVVSAVRNVGLERKARGRKRGPSSGYGQIAESAHPVRKHSFRRTDPIFKDRKN